MKEPGTAHWLAPNTNATNSSGFTGLAAGNRYNNGSFLYFGMYGWGWSSTANNAGAWYLRLNYNDGSVCRGQADKEIISLSGALKLAMPNRSVVSERYLNRQLFQLLKTIVMKKFSKRQQGCVMLLAISCSKQPLGTPQLVNAQMTENINRAAINTGHYIGERFGGGIIFWMTPDSMHGF